MRAPASASPCCRSPPSGLELFDAALAAGRGAARPGRLDLALLRSRASRGHPAAAAARPGPRPRPRRRRRGRLARAAASPPPAEAEREAIALELVRGQVAAVLGHDSAPRSNPERAFKDLGFDSLTAVELRNRLTAATGAAACPPPWSSTTRRPPALAGHLLATRLPARGPSHRGRRCSRRHATSRSRSSAWAAASPAGSDRPEELWELVARGRRRDLRLPRRPRLGPRAAATTPIPASPARATSREGGFLDDAGDFDAGFFGISPREALAMDPQQRLLLETSLGGARGRRASTRARCAAAPTGVFAGVDVPGLRRLRSTPPRSRLPGTGTPAASPPAGSPTRSGWRARRSPSTPPARRRWSRCTWRRRRCAAGECALALAGGVAVIVHADRLRRVHAASAASPPTGAARRSPRRPTAPAGPRASACSCWSGSPTPQRNGHRVLAVVRGSAVNQDGASNGLTAPNGPSQQRVIRQALANAG